MTYHWRVGDHRERSAGEAPCLLCDAVNQQYGDKLPVMPRDEMLAVVRTLEQYARDYANVEEWSIAALLDQAAGCLESALDYWGPNDPQERRTSA